jgi:hypothetical protein
MKVTILKESGYDEAALGFSLSYNSTTDRAKELLPRYAFGNSGETKFLESIYLWLDVTAPRFWWQEADTYRLTTKESESTMHTLLRNKLKHTDFEYPIEDSYLSYLNDLIDLYKDIKNLNKDDPNNYLVSVKNQLPEGFLQRRIWVMNYRVLQNIYNQRCYHKLPQWKYFCNTMLKGCQHPEFLRKEIL